MQLVEIRENAVTVELDWSDVKYLTYLIRHAIRHDVGSSTYEPTMVVTYAETAEAFLLAGGMASWAQTVTPEEYTLDTFREMVPITAGERAAEEARRVEERQQREARAEKGAA